jgi:hypothetical protein
MVIILVFAAVAPSMRAVGWIALRWGTCQDQTNPWPALIVAGTDHQVGWAPRAYYHTPTY